MKRRKNGEGSWGEKKVGNNIYKYYKDSNGVYTYGKTEKEVKEKLVQKKKEAPIITNSDVTSTTTFGNYALYWLPIKFKKLSGATYDCYETMIQQQLINFTDYKLASKQLGGLDARMFQDYFDALAEKYSRNTIVKMKSIINQILKYGEKHNGFKTNLLEDLALTSEENVAVKKKEIPFLNLQDLEALDKESQRINIKGSCYGGKIGEPTYGNNAKAVILIGYTGLRISELCALQWKDIDFEKKVLNVRQAFTTVKNRKKKVSTDNNYLRKLKAPKTTAGIRTIPLPNRAIEILQFFDKFIVHTAEDFVCVSNVGTPLSRHNITRTLQNMIKRADCSVTECSPHTLRHAYGYIMLTSKEYKCDIKIVSYLLGHSDVTTTYNIYIGIGNEMIENVLNAFNKKDNTKSTD